MHSQLQPLPGQEDFSTVVERIRTMYRAFEHHRFDFLRPLTKVVEDNNIVARDPAILSFLKNREFEIGYCGFKAAVVKALGVKSVCETGIGLGMSAMSFLEGNPHIRYIGIDNLENDTVWGYPMSEFVENMLRMAGADYDFIIRNTRELDRLPGKYDLVYVDGDHSREGCRHDVEMAWDSGSEYVLIDDTHHTGVQAGVTDALFNKGLRYIEWAYFPDTWTGNTLFRRPQC